MGRRAWCCLAARCCKHPLLKHWAVVNRFDAAHAMHGCFRYHAAADMAALALLVTALPVSGRCLLFCDAQSVCRDCTTVGCCSGRRTPAPRPFELWSTPRCVCLCAILFD